MMMPRRAKTKPILALAQASRMLAGRVMVIPTPTAEPLIAAMVGLLQLWIASETLPPLYIRFLFLACNGRVMWGGVEWSGVGWEGEVR